ncbi:NAD(P)H dehydrogenase (quinone) [Capnocytophaga sp. HP1101]
MNTKNNNPKILFINGSPNPNGNTAKLAQTLLKGKTYETLNLVQYRINHYGQTLPGDQFDEVLAKMKSADIIVLGSPIYWHNINAAVRDLLDRFYGPVPNGSFAPRQLFFVYQGFAPEAFMINDGEYTVKRFCEMYGFSYQGMANNQAQAQKLAEKLK